MDDTTNVAANYSKYDDVDNIRVVYCTVRRKKITGIWYSIVGTGNIITASTCNEKTNFDTVITVVKKVEGLDCYIKHTCIAQNDDSKECRRNTIHSSVSWLSELGSIYYIYVDGYLIRDTGKFQLDLSETVQDEVVIPSNVVCNEAIELDVPSNTTNGTITGLLPKSLELPNCYRPPSASGMWYTIRGTGNLITLNTCFSGIKFSNKISIFTGIDCELDTCIRLSDSIECPTLSHVSWLSNVGVIYYVYIHGDMKNTGFFHLETSETVVNLPNNVNCDMAMPLKRYGVTECDTTYLAFLDNNSFFTVPGCINSDDIGGLWYTVIGTGNVMRTDTCLGSGVLVDTSTTVMTGKDCNKLDTCLVRNDIAYHKDGCYGESKTGRFSYRGSSVSWASEMGITYYIYVFGQGGRFNLRLTPSNREAPSNLYCDQAIELSVPSSSTSNITEMVIFQNTVNNSCFLPDFTNGIWYTVVGTGKRLTANTCNTGYFIAVFTGYDCKSLDTCVGKNQGSSNCTGSTVSWLSLIGTTYYIYVHGSIYGIGYSVLEVSETQVDLPINVNCNEAIPLDVPSVSTIGDTTYLDSSPNYYGLFVPDCIFPNSTAGLWYTIIGTGKLIEIDTCNEVTTDSIQTSVVTGTDCNNLDTCVTRSYDDEIHYCSGQTGSVSWFSELGIMYYLYVNTYSRSGKFQLQIPIRDDCNYAIPLDIPSKRNGSIFKFYSRNVPDISSSCRVSDSSLGVWYTVVGNGNLLMANTCGSATDFDTILSIYTGEQCDTLDTCVASNDDSNFCSQGSKKSSVSWLSEKGIIYFIYVHSSSEGDYELSVSEIFSNVPLNVHCITSVPLDIPMAIQGSTVFAGISQHELDIPLCANGSDLEPGMWYTVKGTGKRITADTCNNFTDFDMAIAVYEGTGCDSVNHCVARNDNGCQGFGASVSWSSDSEKTYYIHIHGSRHRWGLESGNFELSISDNGKSNRVICFSGQNLVDIKDKGKALMKELQIGDLVKVSSSDAESGYSPVISFSHKDEFGEAEYLQLFTSHATNPTTKNISLIEISSDHLVFKYDGTMVRAKDIQMGDILDGYAVVTRIEHVKRRGLYAPVTAAGTLVVSGVTASSYVALLTSVPEYVQHYAAHALYAPIRLQYEYNSNHFCNHFCNSHTNIENEEKYTEDGFSNNYVTLVIKLVLHVSFQPVMVQVGLMLLCAPFVIVILTIEKVVACGHLSMFIAFILTFTMKWMSLKNKDKKN